MLLKSELLDFANRFASYLYPQGVKGRDGKIRLSEIQDIIKSFIMPTKNIKDFNSSFTKTRIELFKICLQERSPEKRWNRTKLFLFDNLESQVFWKSRNDSKNEFESWRVVDSLMGESYLNQCFKLIALFNLLDQYLELPEDVDIRISKNRFPNYDLFQKGLLLRAKTNDNECLERYIILDELEFLKLNSTLCSKLLVNNTNIFNVRHDYFHDVLINNYLKLVKKYRIQSSDKPSLAMAKIKNSSSAFSYESEEMQRIVLKTLTGMWPNEWKWFDEEVEMLDGPKIVNDYFPAHIGVIKSVNYESNPDWRFKESLNNEDCLRFEFADIYLMKLKRLEREELLKNAFLLSSKKIQFFHLKSFLDILSSWERENPSKILSLFKSAEKTYSTQDQNKRENIIQYLEIYKLLMRRCSQREACKIVSPFEKVETVRQRFKRVKAYLETELGINTKNPDHIKEIQNMWSINDEVSVLRL